MSGNENDGDVSGAGPWGPRGGERFIEDPNTGAVYDRHPPLGASYDDARDPDPEPPKDRRRKKRQRVETPEGWERVKAPRKFEGMEGEMLEGEYLGSENRDGRHGPYVVHFVRERVSIDAPNVKQIFGDVWYVTGYHAHQLFLAAHPLVGMQVRLVVTDTDTTDDGHVVRHWEMLVRRTSP